MSKEDERSLMISFRFIKLKQGQKVDPQAHMGQMIDESTKASDEGLVFDCLCVTKSKFSFQQICESMRENN